MPLSVPVSRRTTLLATGLLAGTLDALAATTHYVLRTGKPPAGVWRYVAGALVSPDAAIGPAARVLIGVSLHLCLAMMWTLLFFGGASRLRWMRGSPWIVGPLYGLFVWAMMTRVLVPLTRLGPPTTFDPIQSLIGAVIIMACIGLPIAFGAERYRR
jgi:hypothetical protein